MLLKRGATVMHFDGKKEVQLSPMVFCAVKGERRCFCCPGSSFETSPWLCPPAEGHFACGFLSLCPNR
eukprot:3204778-Rhodomonas_salina.1